MTQNAPNLISVLSSTARGVIGFLLNSAKGFRSFDRDGQPIGMFSDKEKAVRSIYEASTTGST